MPLTPAGSQIENSSGGSAGVTSLNSETGAITLVGGAGITVTPSGSNININAATSLFTKALFTSATRQYNVAYQNLTGQPIIVMIGSNNASGSGLLITVVCDASSTPTTVIGEQAVSAGFVTSFLLVVPNNYYYKVFGSGGGTTNWTEWTINSGSVTFSGELSGSRALATVYQNTSGKAMFIVADISGLSSTTVVSAISDSGSSPTATVYSFTANVASAHVTVFFCVPNNHYYKVTGSGGAVAHWNEYMMPFNATKSIDFGASAPAERGLTNGTSLDTPAANTYIGPNWFNNQGKDVFFSICEHFATTGTFESYAGSCSVPVFTGFCQWRMSNTTGIQCPGIGLAEPGEFYIAGLDNGSIVPTLDHWWEYQLA